MLLGVAVNQKSVFSQRLFKSWRRTNLAFLRHASTSEGKDDETCGWVADAEASQFNGGC